MKNIIIALLCFLTFTYSYAQDTKPTKQETMDWIAGKFKDNINTQIQTYEYGRKIVQQKFDFISYNNYGIIKFSCSFLSSEPPRTIIYTLNLNKVIEVKGFKGEALYIEGDKLECSIENDCNDVLLIYNEDYKLLRGLGINDLLNRLIKSFEVLIEYNKSEKPKEKF